MLADTDKAIDRLARAAVEDFLPPGLTFEKLKKGLPCYMKVRHPDAKRIGFDECLADLGLEKYQDQTTNQQKIRAIVKRDEADKVVKERTVSHKSIRDSPHSSLLNSSAMSASIAFPLQSMV